MTRRALKPLASSRAPRAAFTLVEMLVVIAIIGVLATMTSLVVAKAIRSANEKAVIAEMTNLEGAIKIYRDQHSQLPPNMGDAAMYSKTQPLRQWRFDQHRARAWPRCTVSYASLYSYLINNTSNYYNYSIYVNGKQTKLDLSTLDPAEALVFWLGGFPGPTDSSGNPLTASKLIGFHSDPTNPFRLDIYNPKSPLAFIQSRTAKLFDFDEGRLVDNDQDGWYEYVPRGVSAVNGLQPPYVYFDAGGYGYSWVSQSVPPFNGYPAPIIGSQQSGNDTQMTTLAGAAASSSSGSGGGGGGGGGYGGGSGSSQVSDGWGLAVPYARSFNMNGGLLPAQWINPEGVQIVAAGSDGKYSATSSLRIPVYPSGTTYTGTGFSTTSYYDDAEQDNLVNFADASLKDQVERNN